MTKALTLLSIIALLAAAPIFGHGEGVVHSATGSGHMQLGGELRTFSFSAVERNDGSVTGQAQLQARLVDSTSHVEIDCLNVVGNVAIVSGTLDSGITGAFAVEDNGEGGNAPPDRITLLNTVRSSRRASASSSHRQSWPPSCCRSRKATSRFARRTHEDSDHTSEHHRAARCNADPRPGERVVHSATGGGNIRVGDALRTFGFSTVQRSDGSATGRSQIEARQFGNTIHIEVNCLKVTGSVALDQWNDHAAHGSRRGRHHCRTGSRGQRRGRERSRGPHDVPVRLSTGDAGVPAVRAS